MRCSSAGRLVCGMLLLVAAFALSGCGPASRHALSNEETSLIDPSLIGGWRIHDPGRQPELESTVAIGRLPQGQNTLEAVGMEIDENGVVEIKRAMVYTTTVGDFHCLSIDVRENTDDKPAFQIVRYRLSAGGKRAEIFHLTEIFVRAAVKRGELEGEAEDDKQTVITAQPDQIRRFIRQHGENCFDMKEPVVVLNKLG